MLQATTRRRSHKQQPQHTVLSYLVGHIQNAEEFSRDPLACAFGILVSECLPLIPVVPLEDGEDAAAGGGGGEAEGGQME